MNMDFHALAGKEDKMRIKHTDKNKRKKKIKKRRVLDIYLNVGEI